MENGRSDLVRLHRASGVVPSSNLLHHVSGVLSAAVALPSISRDDIHSVVPNEVPGVLAICALDEVSFAAT
jgi:hypothetical protein